MSQPLIDDIFLYVDGLIKQQHAASSVTVAVAVAVVVPLVLVLTKKAFFLPLDAREPPVRRPTIPLVGHIIGLVRESGDYYQRIL